MILKYLNNQITIHNITLSNTINNFFNQYSINIESELKCNITKILVLFNGILLDHSKTFEFYKITNNNILYIQDNNYKKISLKKIKPIIDKILDNMTDINQLDTNNSNLTQNSEPVSENLYEKELSQLNNMGFTNIDENIQILDMVGGNLEQALVYLTD